MAKIEKLSPQLANMIAAGEVVERPGSVIKELVENAIDAGATAITVEIRRGGAAYMRVTDNGCGIPAGEVRTAFLRHATSKLKTAEDLQRIGTMGFRGEALAAVAAVSRVDMFTKTKDSPLGTQISLEAGQETSFQETGCPDGTTIVVRDLFYNVPARMKFLKKDQTEGAYAESAVTNAALAAPAVAVTFIKDGREVFSTPGDGKLRSVVRAVYGRELLEQLIPTECTVGEIKVTGLVSAPTVTRASRTLQLFFINRRPVRSRIMGAALEEAYKGKIMSGRYPACILQLEMNPAAVDVNVHPAKLEVKFAREREVFSAVHSAAAFALDSLSVRDSAPEPVMRRPAVTEDTVTEAQQKIEIPAPAAAPPPRIVPTFPEAHAGALQKVAQPSHRIPYTPIPPSPEKQKLIDQVLEQYRKAALEEEEEPRRPARELPCIPYRPDPAKAQRFPDEADGLVIGECFDSFVIVEQGEDLWLLDKHAAHERVLYNKLLQQKGDPDSQLLLEPLPVRLSPEEQQACLDHRDILEKAGFAAEDFGAAGLALRQIPTYLAQADAPFVLSDMAKRLLERRDPDLNRVYDDLLKSIACKAAVKAGSALHGPELRRVALMALTFPDVRNCPHGRPVAVRLTKTQIEKLFKRIV